MLKKGYKSIDNRGHHSQCFQTNSINKFSKLQGLIWKTQLLLPHLGRVIHGSVLEPTGTSAHHSCGSSMVRWIQIQLGRTLLQRLMAKLCATNLGLALGGSGSLPPHWMGFLSFMDSIVAFTWSFMVCLMALLEPLVSFMA